MKVLHTTTNREVVEVDDVKLDEIKVSEILGGDPRIMLIGREMVDGKQTYHSQYAHPDMGDMPLDLQAQLIAWASGQLRQHAEKSVAEAA